MLHSHVVLQVRFKDYFVITLSTGSQNPSSNEELLLSESFQFGGVSPKGWHIEIDLFHETFSTIVALLFFNVVFFFKYVF